MGAAHDMLAPTTSALLSITIPLKGDYKRQINHLVGRTGYSFCLGVQMIEIWIYTAWVMVWPNGQGLGRIRVEG